MIQKNKTVPGQDLSYLRYSKPYEIKNKKDRLIFRFLEMLPGILAWSTFAIIIVGSKFFPEQISLFLIAFILFWFLRTIYLFFLLRSGFKQTKRNEHEPWDKKLELLSFPRPTLPSVSSWKDLWHLVILPTYQEPYEVLKDSLEALLQSGYPTRKMIVVVAFEQREGQAAQEKAKRIEKEYQKQFGHFLCTFHPDMPGELAGKGANETYAAKQVKEKLIDPLKIPYAHIIVTVLDADTRVGKNFFNCLSYHYLTCEKPLRSSFQPVPIYTNNIWDAPPLVPVISFSTTFWQMIQQSRPEILITFSSHSMGFQPLVEIGFWQENVVSEDSRIFYQCLLYFDGDWSVEPLHFPVYMDANIAPTFWQTMKNQYKQQRRWGYGAENIPYLLFGFLKNKRIHWRKKWQYGFNIIEGFHSWNTHSIILFVLGWLPIILGNHSFKFTILSYNLPQIAGLFMRVATIGVFISAYLANFLLPQEPKTRKKLSRLSIAFQWLLGPLVIFLSTIPALEASTRLMLGKYLGFWVTPKQRPVSTNLKS